MNRTPITQVIGTYGSGAMTAVSPANSAVAPTVPSLLYIASAKRGKAAANVERVALFDAMADAAIGRYAVTRYVNVEVKTKKKPDPNGIDAMIGTIQGTVGYVVNASQKRPRIGGVR